jgi:cytochrome b561
MQIRNTMQRYGALAQLFHWLVALGFVGQFALAWYMEGLPNGPFKIELYNLHKSIGVTILALAVLRIAWRWANPVPPMPEGSARWEVLASRASHVLLYAFLFAQPLSGLIFSLYSSFPTLIYGVSLPSPGAVPWVESAFMAVHYWLSWAILALVGVHVAAALRHHFILRDSVLVRMLPGAGKARDADRSRSATTS